LEGLGKWYDHEGGAQYGHLPETQSLDKPHQELHATIKKIIDLTRDGRKNAAEALLPDVDRLSDQVVSILDRLDRSA
jgi:hypothetical protein